MEEIIQEESSSTTIAPSRQRNANFTTEEVNTLINLVDKFKYALCNSNTNKQASRRRDAAWKSITASFKSHGFNRSMECLKTKWDNLRREARKFTVDSSDMMDDKYPSALTRICEMMLDVRNHPEAENCFDSEENDEDYKSTSVRHRSHTFKPEETKILVDLVEQYKYFIFNKSNSNPINQSKEKAWTEITRKFNSKGLDRERSLESLRYKWENLKKKAREMHKYYPEKGYDCDEVIEKIIKMFQEDDSTVCPSDEANSCEQNVTDSSVTDGTLTRNRESDYESDDGTRSSEIDDKFSPQECKLLLQCVRLEKKNVFILRKSPRSVEIRNQAWVKIAEEFNNKNAKNRTARELRTKFQNMRKIASGTRINKYFDFSMKPEILSEAKMEFETRIKQEQTVDDDTEPKDEIEFNNSPSYDFNDVTAPDPLGTVTNADSGIGSNSHTDGWIQSGNNDYHKLRLELLNYKFETAKMERRRVEDAIKADAESREKLAIERSLRLRAARLSVLAAEAQLTHLAQRELHYPPEETRAQLYLEQYRDRDGDI